jgi:beta-lysine 5,6-aminomutase alpha subunit
MQLTIDSEVPRHCRILAQTIVQPVIEFIEQHSTNSVERSVARLLGVTGVYGDEQPLANALVDGLPTGLRAQGIAHVLGAVMAQQHVNLNEAAMLIASATCDLALVPLIPRAVVETQILPHVTSAIACIDAHRAAREAALARLPQGPTPLLYVIVASGDIYEDRSAAVAAAEAGAQVIAVIRSTGQSLLDFVPEGATTEGFGGTYATQENFRIMRAALDEASERLGRYIMLTNYASGLCMPEIAAMAALERLDMLLNDSMYGILFRDINMERTFIDQFFSRRLNARAGIIINTGEDNYLTTADAVAQAPAVLASQFINEAFAHRAGLPDQQIGLGDAFEIDPKIENALALQIAQALLARQVFPNAPLKYMPPTKHMTGDIFQGNLTDAMFNLTSVLTKQTIHLCGMMTEAIHTPLVMDRALSLSNAQYVFRTARDLGDEFELRSDGIIAKRAATVLSGAVDLLEQIADRGLMPAIEEGMFADVKRRRTGGRGYDGVFRRAATYWNPFEERLAL